MKFRRGFSLFASIFIILQLHTSAAVSCPYGSINVAYDSKFKEEIQLTSGRKECVNNCAAYICSDGISGSGCVEDFLSDCSKHESDIQFIKRKTLYNMEFASLHLTYVSGCGNEKDGEKCLVKKMKDLYNEIGSNAKNGGQQIYWSASKDGKLNNVTNGPVPSIPSSRRHPRPVSQARNQ
uniref:Uncharacterized protein n=1 Tax=Panagrolaimus sp. ES5 TaxID=591445 RepID=A0AC34FPJ3_9BILA